MIAQKLHNIIEHVTRIAKLYRTSETVLINQGRILASLNSDRRYGQLSDYEFKVFSQFGEDGIIQHLTQNLAIESKTFIEFGVENFQESNCRFLMMKDLWRGFVIDGSTKNINSLKSSYFYWQYQIQAECGFIDKDSIHSILQRSDFGKSPGILSVDIDGVDYHILKELDQWTPSILIVEYNSLFGSQLSVTVPYAPDFVRSERHYSNQYWGASLPAFSDLAAERGMSLVGVTSTGQNAFFVRNELLNDVVRKVTVEDCFRKMCFRDGRDKKGKLTFAGVAESRDLIGDLPLTNTRDGSELRVNELPPE